MVYVYISMSYICVYMYILTNGGECDDITIIIFFVHYCNHTVYDRHKFGYHVGW